MPDLAGAQTVLGSMVTPQASWIEVFEQDPKEARSLAFGVSMKWGHDRELRANAATIERAGMPNEFIDASPWATDAAVVVDLDFTRKDDSRALGHGQLADFLTNAWADASKIADRFTPRFEAGRT